MTNVKRELEKLHPEGEQSLVPSAGRNSALNHQRDPESKLKSDEPFHSMERNMIMLGVFSPSSKNSKKRESKVLKISWVNESGSREEAAIKIITPRELGLPATTDLDMWLAFHLLVNSILDAEGQVQNPIKFSRYRLLQIAEKKLLGFDYTKINEWLDRMTMTTIVAVKEARLQGGVRIKDRQHIFERVYSKGSTLEDGTEADEDQVYLAEWLLRSINENWRIPIDLNTYRKLKKPTAKVLFFILQMNLYATREVGSYEKDYHALCELLGIKEYTNISTVEQKLKPPLDELKKHGLLKGWSIEKRKNDVGFKVKFYHGEKFYQLLEKTTGTKELGAGDGANEGEIDDEHSLVKELVEREVSHSMARKLVTELDTTDLLDKLDVIDDEVRRRKPPLENPGGFYVMRLREGVVLPPNFITSRMRAENQKKIQKVAAGETNRIQLELDYEEYRREMILNQIETMTPDARNLLFNQSEEMLRRANPELAKRLTAANRDAWLTPYAVKSVEPDTVLQSFEEFVKSKEIGVAAKRA